MSWSRESRHKNQETYPESANQCTRPLDLKGRYMTTEKVSLNQFIIALCESPYRWIQQATEGLTDEQLYYQPSSDTNSIAWLIWHLSRWRDKVSAAIVGEPQVWTSEGWAHRFEFDTDRTGLGDTLEQLPPSA